MGAVLSTLINTVRQRPKVALALVLLLAYRYLRRRGAPAGKPNPAGYDFVVAGGGTSGTIVAARLSEDPDVSVLLLEAGGEAADSRIKVPVLGARLQCDPEYDWMVRTTPQANACGGLHDRVSFWPRGKVLGGSSCLNNMIYVRGNKGDYDEWSEKYGCEGWSFDEVLPYFKKAERNTVPGVDAGYHSADGTMTISTLDDYNPSSQGFVEACAELGTPTGDTNGSDQMRANRSPVNVAGGQRDHVARCYLDDARKRANLTVITRAHVTRVVIENNRCTGVAYKEAKLGITREQFQAAPEIVVPVKREAIVSGGTVHSPQILMLSGLGPKAHLEEFGIECVQDLPMVGQNLQDHLMVGLSYNINSPALNNATTLNSLKWAAQYFLMGKGPFKSTVIEAYSFHNVGVRQDLAARGVPDLQIQYAPFGWPGLQHDDSTEGNWNIVNARETFPYDDPNYRPDGCILLPTLLHPKSIGEVKLKSASAFDLPSVDPHYLEHPDDVRVLAEGLKLSKKLCETKAFSKHSDGWRRPWHKNPHPVGSDAYWEFQVRQLALTVYHPVGTVAMGADASIAALTPDLKVRGIAGLRVADCSVMPTIPSANTHAPAIMIGEKCADLIKAAFARESSHAKL